MRYSTDDMRNYAADTKFDFGVKFAMKEAADEIEELREALRLAGKALTRVIADIQSELPES